MSKFTSPLQDPFRCIKRLDNADDDDVAYEHKGYPTFTQNSTWNLGFVRIRSPYL